MANAIVFLIASQQRLRLKNYLLPGLSNGSVIDGLAGFQCDTISVSDETAGNSQHFGARHHNSDQIQWIGC